MVIDSSAMVALLQREASARSIARALDADPLRLVSAATLVEVGIVLEGRNGERGRVLLDRFMALHPCDVMPVDARTAEVALDGWRRFGKGRHAAALNFGDCFAYALAKRTGQPILCVGNDFVQTDVAVVPLEGEQ